MENIKLKLLLKYIQQTTKIIDNMNDEEIKEILNRKNIKDDYRNIICQLSSRFEVF